MSFSTITDDELVNMGVTGLPDVPDLSTEAMQAQFDEYPRFLKDKFKTHISELEAKTAASNIGAEIPEELSDIVPDGATEEEAAEYEKVQPILDELATRAKDLKDWQDNADQNFSPTELNTAAFHADEEVVTVPTLATSDVSNKAASTKFVDDKMRNIGAGDMAKSVYDPNDRGKVETAYKVGESYVESIETVETSFPVPAANDKIKTIVGKIIKFLSDIRTTGATQETMGMMSAEDKIKLDGITKLAQNSEYATCSTESFTAAKVVTVSNTDFKLRSGAIVCILFSHTNVISNPTLNVNGTGAKSVLYNNEVIFDANLSYAGDSSRPMTYMYDGTYWVFIGDTKIYVDGTMNLTSVNSVQNKIITQAVSQILGDICETDLSDKATRPHASGKYLIYGTLPTPHFGKTKTAIAVGETFNANNGGNIESTTVATAVSNLNNALNWQVLGTISGSNSIQITNLNIREIMIVAHLSNTVNYVFNINKQVLVDTSVQRIVQGFNNTNQNYVIIGIASPYITIENMMLNGTDVKASGVGNVTVYVR